MRAQSAAFSTVWSDVLAAVVPPFLISRGFILVLALILTDGLAGGVWPLPPSVHPGTLSPLSNAWDAGWYISIARDGYDPSATAAVQHNYAFFPLLPLLMRLLVGAAHPPERLWAGRGGDQPSRLFRRAGRAVPADGGGLPRPGDGAAHALDYGAVAVGLRLLDGLYRGAVPAPLQRGDLVRLAGGLHPEQRRDGANLDGVGPALRGPGGADPPAGGAGGYRGGLAAGAAGGGPDRAAAARCWSPRRWWWPEAASSPSSSISGC